MRTSSLAVAMVIGFGSLLQADPPKDEPDRKTARAQMYKQILEKFDKNENGKIDEDERDAIRAEFAKRREAAQKEAAKEAAKKAESHRHSPPDWAKRREDFKSRMEAAHKEFMEKFDKNENGKIDGDEKEAVAADFRSKISGAIVRQSSAWDVAPIVSRTSSPPR